LHQGGRQIPVIGYSITVVIQIVTGDFFLIGIHVGPAVVTISADGYVAGRRRGQTAGKRSTFVAKAISVQIGVKDLIGASQVPGTMQTDFIQGNITKRPA
jgi:putative Mn2+ efflux pump MntP